MLRLVRALPLVLLALAAIRAPPALAEEVYEASSSCGWRQSHFDVVIVPPGGPYAFYGDSDVVDPTDPVILAPDTSVPWDGAHARAAAAAIDAWQAALHARADEHPGEAHLRQVTFRHTILGPEVDPRIVEEADILVLFTPVQDAGGRAVVSCTSPTQRVVQDGDGIRLDLFVGTYIVMNQWFVYSYTVADTYNIVLHEFGHALGLRHIDRPVGDVMNSVYGHSIGNVHNPLHCLSNLDVAQAANGFRWLDGVAPQGPPPPTLMPASRYERPC